MMSSKGKGAKRGETAAAHRGEPVAKKGKPEMDPDPLFLFSDFEKACKPPALLFMEYMDLVGQGIRYQDTDSRMDGWTGVSDGEDEEEECDEGELCSHVETSVVDALVKEFKEKFAQDQLFNRARLRGDEDFEKTWEQECEDGKAEVERVNALLKAAGCEGDDCPTSRCLLAGLAKGHYGFTGQPGDMDKVVIMDKGECEHMIRVTVRDLFHQPDSGADYEDGSESAVIACKEEDTSESSGKCPYRYYVANLCEGQPRLDCGKFHNHCYECPGFGTCLGDYRSVHCYRCHDHYFSGLSGFPCQCEKYDVLIRDASKKKRVALATLHFLCKFKVGRARREYENQNEEDESDES